jgi:F0F1-type ATP synthase assembly protein I
LPDKSFYTRMGRLASIVTILPGSMAAGWLFGYFVLDRYFTSYPWGSLCLTMLGACAGFYEIVRLLLDDRKGRDGS